MKNRIHLAIALVLTAFAANAQTVPVSSVRVYTDPPGARFYVDGVSYYASQTFLWPQGSKHIVQFPVSTFSDGTYQQSLDGNTRFTFGGWTDSSSNITVNDPNYTITASPSVTELKAVISASFRTQIRFSSAPDAAVTCGGPGDPLRDGLRVGIVYVDGSCFGTNVDVFLVKGLHTLSAFPYPGFIFTGWSINGGGADPYARTYDLTGPATIYAAFQPAKRVQFLTSPAGLQVLVDRSPTPTTNTFIVDTSTVTNVDAAL